MRWMGLLAVALAACSVALDGYTSGDSADTAVPDDGDAASAADGGGSGGGGDASTTADATGTDPGPTSAYAKAVLADAPLGYYRLGESASGSGVAVDSSSGKHDGQYQADVTRGLKGAIATDTDTSIRNSGDNAAVVVPGDVFDFPGNAPYSLEAWAAVTADPTRVQGICGKKTVGSTQAPAVEDFGYSLWYTDELGFGRYTAEGPATDIRVPAPDAAYHHVVGTFDGSTMRLYLDGALVKSGTSEVTLADTAPSFAIGDKGEDYGNPATGGIDEVAVYDHALTAERVAAHYAAATK